MLKPHKPTALRPSKCNFFSHPEINSTHAPAITTNKQKTTVSTTEILLVYLWTHPRSNQALTSTKMQTETPLKPNQTEH